MMMMIMMIILIQLFTMIISNNVKQDILSLLLMIIVLKEIIMMILLIAQEITIMRNYSAYILKRPLKGRKQRNMIQKIMQGQKTKKYDKVTLSLQKSLFAAFCKI